MLRFYSKGCIKLAVMVLLFEDPQISNFEYQAEGRSGRSKGKLKFSIALVIALILRKLSKPLYKLSVSNQCSITIDFESFDYQRILYRCISCSNVRDDYVCSFLVDF